MDTAQKYRADTIKKFMHLLFDKIQNQNLYICITYARRNSNGKNENFKDEYFPCTCSGIDEASIYAVSIDKSMEIYFRCAVLSEKTRNGESAKMIPFLFADIDFKGNKSNYPELKDVFDMFSEKGIPTPTTTIHTGNGYHCYWVLKDPLKVQEFPDIYKKWLYLLKSKLGKEMDLNSELAKILRIPCTYNNKKSENPLHVSTTAIGNNRFYDLDEVMKQYERETPLTYTQTCGGTVSTENHVSTTEKKCRNSISNLSKQSKKMTYQDYDLKRLFKNDKRMEDLYSGEYKKLGYPSQSEGDMAFCGMLAFYFNDSEAVKTIFISSKMFRKSKGMKYIERTVAKAMSNRIKPVEATLISIKKSGLYELKRLHGKILQNRHIIVYSAIIDIEKENHYPAGHVVFAGYRKISRIARLSKETICRALKELEQYGLITLKIGEQNSREKTATEIKRIIPIPKKLQVVTA